MYKILMILALTFSLSACADKQTDYQASLDKVENERHALLGEEANNNTYEALKQGIREDTMEIRGSIAAIVYPEMAQFPLQEEEGTTKSEVRNVYCYKTIGQVDCYKSPIRGQEGRLVGN